MGPRSTRLVASTLLVATVLGFLACKGPDERARDAVAEGDAALAAGRLDEADADYGRALVLKPGLPEAVAGTARVALARDDARGALAALRGCDAPPCAAVAKDAAPRVRDALARGDLKGDDAQQYVAAAVLAGETPRCGVLDALREMAARKSRGQQLSMDLVDAAHDGIERFQAHVSDDAPTNGFGLARGRGEGAGKMRTCAELRSLETGAEGQYRALRSAVTGQEDTPDPLDILRGTSDSELRSEVVAYYALRAVFEDVTGRDFDPPQDAGTAAAEQGGPLDAGRNDAGDAGADAGRKDSGPDDGGRRDGATRRDSGSTWPPEGPDCEKFVACCDAMNAIVPSMMICMISLDEGGGCTKGIDKMRSHIRATGLALPEACRAAP